MDQNSDNRVLNDGSLDKVSGGTGAVPNMPNCPQCGGTSKVTIIGQEERSITYLCFNCGYSWKVSF